MGTKTCTHNVIIPTRASLPSVTRERWRQNRPHWLQFGGNIVFLLVLLLCSHHAAPASSKCYILADNGIHTGTSRPDLTCEEDSAQTCDDVVLPDGLSLAGVYGAVYEDLPYWVWTIRDIGPGGDLNGDGFSDFAYASREYCLNESTNEMEYSGYTTWHVVFGNDSSTQEPPNSVVERVFANSSGSRFAFMADLTGDGLCELIGDDGRGDHHAGNFTIKVFEGTETGVGEQIFEFFIPDEWCWVRSVSVGDFDADGCDDVVFALSSGPDMWTVLTIFGAQEASQIEAVPVPREVDSSPFLCVCHVSLGDVDGDGFDDLVASEHSWSRFLYYHGNAERSFDPVAIYGPGGYGLFSDPLGIVGDINGDGCEETVAWGYLQEPARLSYGRNDELLFNEWSYLLTDNLSSDGAVVPVGDLNGDGFDDLALGQYAQTIFHNDGTYTVSPGVVYVFFGSAEGPIGPFRINGTLYGQWLGNSVAGLGDIDGDGRDEFGILDHHLNGSRFLVIDVDPSKLPILSTVAASNTSSSSFWDIRTVATGTLTAACIATAVLLIKKRKKPG